jgi:hypothetical protein
MMPARRARGDHFRPATHRAARDIYGPGAGHDVRAGGRLRVGAGLENAKKRLLIIRL